VRNIPFPEFVARPTVFAFDEQREYPRILGGGLCKARLILLSRNLRELREYTYACIVRWIQTLRGSA